MALNHPSCQVFLGFDSKYRSGLWQKIVFCHRFEICSLLGYERDVVLGDPKYKLAGSLICESTLAHFYVLSLVLANLESLCIGDSTWDMVT